MPSRWQWCLAQEAKSANVCAPEKESFSAQEIPRGSSLDSEPRLEVACREGKAKGRKTHWLLRMLDRPLSSGLRPFWFSISSHFSGCFKGQYYAINFHFCNSIPNRSTELQTHISNWPLAISIWMLTGKCLKLDS